MRQRGFTLIELLIVISIMGALAALSTVQFSRMQKKGAIEREVVTIYSSLSEVRLQALYTKTPRTVVLSGSQLRIYSSVDTTLTPLSVVALPYPVVMTAGADQVAFNGSGMMLDSERAICVQPSGVAANPGNTDSVVVSAARIYKGKRQSGGACAANAIDQK